MAKVSEQEKIVRDAFGVFSDIVRSAETQPDAPHAKLAETLKSLNKEFSYKNRDRLFKEARTPLGSPTVLGYVIQLLDIAMARYLPAIGTQGSQQPSIESSLAIHFVRMRGFCYFTEAEIRRTNSPEIRNNPEKIKSILRQLAEAENVGLQNALTSEPARKSTTGRTRKRKPGSDPEVN